MRTPLNAQDAEDRQDFQQQMITYYEDHGRELPWRVTASDFHVLAALIMLQRTSVGQVSNVFPVFQNQYPEPETVLAAADTELEDLLAPLGLPNRVQYLRSVATFFSSNGEPTQQNLLEITGVGRYTANAFLSIHRNEPYPIVDVNVERVFDHFFDTDELDYWELAEMVLPEEHVCAYNLGLLDYGAKLRRER